MSETLSMMRFFQFFSVFLWFLISMVYVALVKVGLRGEEFHASKAKLWSMLVLIFVIFWVVIITELKILAPYDIGGWIWAVMLLTILVFAVFIPSILRLL